MKTKTITLYTFDELSDGAKEKARDWWRECIDTGDFECVIEDAVNIGALLGIEIDTHAVPLMNGKTRQEPTIYWSGFYSQGDGACFEASYIYKKGAARSIISETSSGRDDASKGDKTLLRIARDLQDIQRRNFYQLRATTKHTGHYSHAYSMSVDVERYDEKEMTDDAEKIVTALLRDFANWVYAQLNIQNDYLYSEKNVDDAIRANDYTFTANGKRED